MAKSKKKAQPASDPPEDPTPPAPPQPDTPYPPHDGPRYVAGLQDPKQTNLYKDFHASEKLDEVKKEASGEAKEHGRVCVIYDRKIGMIITRFDKDGIEVVPEEKDEKKKKK